mgnify:CR=1 FL=1
MITGTVFIRHFFLSTSCFPSDFCSSSTFNSPTASFSLLFCLDFTAQDKMAGIFLDIFMRSFILISFFYDIGDICVLYIVWDATVGILSAVRYYKLGRHYNIATVEDIKFKLMSAFSASLKVWAFWYWGYQLRFFSRIKVRWKCLFTIVPLLSKVPSSRAYDTPFSMGIFKPEFLSYMHDKKAIGNHLFYLIGASPTGHIKSNIQHGSKLRPLASNADAFTTNQRWWRRCKTVRFEDCFYNIWNASDDNWTHCFIDIRTGTTLLHVA